MAQLAALELIWNAGLLRGRFTASCCALGARSSWHIVVRDGSKSGHLGGAENDEKLRNALLAASYANWAVKTDGRRGNQRVYM
jgi:hypothetical protein